MGQVREICRTVVENGAAVLMARIVDGAGTLLRPDEVSLIGYSILERSERDDANWQALPEHDCVALDVNEVLLDSLTNDRLWSVDACGFNFRHELRPNRHGFPRPGVVYELRYLFVLKYGEPAILRFQVRFHFYE